jgi:hypothetical protein
MRLALFWLDALLLGRTEPGTLLSVILELYRAKLLARENKSEPPRACALGGVSTKVPQFVSKTHKGIRYEAHKQNCARRITYTMNTIL